MAAQLATQTAIDKPERLDFKTPYFSQSLLAKARANWSRYEYGRMRGHRFYMEQAKRCERFYLGGGLQWEHDDYETLVEANIKPVENNQILPKINSALGYQISNRMDITFMPRNGGADDDKATILTKVIKQVLDTNTFHYKETVVCGDGFIQQRGFYDLRMAYDNNIFGEIDIGTLDPLDVIPDPDAKSYDPNDWSDVLVTRWYSFDEIEQYFGKEARQAVESYKAYERDFGDYNEEERRNKFGTQYLGDSSDMYDMILDGIDTRRIRVIDRQYFVRERIKVAVWPTGEVVSVEDATPEQLAMWKEDGAHFTKRFMKRVRWLISTSDIVLHDDYSPFPFFTVVPFFPIFRRGLTRGLVDNAISPQELQNKALTSYLHIVNGAANSGWIIEDNSITNMGDIEFEDKGAQTGLIIKVKPDAKFKPEKIQPNAPPMGIDKIIDRSYTSISDVMGINESMEGQDTNEDMSGIAIQSRQFAAQQKLAVPLDNLAMTRQMLGKRLLWMIQNFYDGPRLFRITNDDGAGEQTTTDLPVNHQMDDGSILNDLTIGEYDVVISTQPLHITFDNSQFEQVMKMRDGGIAIPDSWVLKYSNLQEKNQIAKEMAQKQTPQPDPLTEAKTALANAQAQAAQAKADQTKASTTQTNVTAIFGATQAAAQAATMPSIAEVADAILASAGFEQSGNVASTGPVPQDVPQGMSGPIPPLDAGLPNLGAPQAGLPKPGVPAAAAVPGSVQMPQNTHPDFPAKPGSPDKGADAGIEGGSPPGA